MIPMKINRINHNPVIDYWRYIKAPQFGPHLKEIYEAKQKRYAEESATYIQGTRMHSLFMKGFNGKKPDLLICTQQKLHTDLSYDTTALLLISDTTPEIIGRGTQNTKIYQYDIVVLDQLKPHGLYSPDNRPSYFLVFDFHIKHPTMSNMEVTELARVQPNYRASYKRKLIGEPDIKRHIVEGYFNRSIPFIDSKNSSALTL